MSAKVFLVFCAHAVFVQSALSQCNGRPAAAVVPGIAASAWNSPYGMGAPYGLGVPALTGTYGIATPGLEYSPTSGGLLPLSSGSGLAPIGISVTSENMYEGALTVTGELPFVGTVGLEGVLPTAGTGVVNHACGNGVNGMVSDPAALALPYASAIAANAGLAPFGAVIGPVIGTPRPPYARAIPEFAAPVLATPGLEFTPTSGGLLPISSGSAIAPSGITVASESAYDGILEVVGELPFVGTVGLEGVLPTAGTGVVNHSCGNGVNAMASENVAFAPAYAGAITPGFAAPSLGWAGRGCSYAL